MYVSIYHPSVSSPLRSPPLTPFTTLTLLLQFSENTWCTIENNCEIDAGSGRNGLAFHDMLYYVIVTISTVGYGDICPRGVVSRYLAIALIAIALGKIPAQLNTLAVLLGSRSVYARARYVQREEGVRHVTILGEIHSTAILDFFAEVRKRRGEGGGRTIKCIGSYRGSTVVLHTRGHTYVNALVLCVCVCVCVCEC